MLYADPYENVRSHFYKLQYIVSQVIIFISYLQTWPRPNFSMSNYETSLTEEHQEDVENEQSEQWSVSSVAHTIEVQKSSRMKSTSLSRSQSLTLSKLFSKSKSFSKYFSKSIIKSVSSKSKRMRSETLTRDESTHSEDDLDVHLSIL